MQTDILTSFTCWVLGDGMDRISTLLHHRRSLPHECGIPVGSNPQRLRYFMALIGISREMTIDQVQTMCSLLNVWIQWERLVAWWKKMDLSLPWHLHRVISISTLLISVVMWTSPCRGGGGMPISHILEPMSMHTFSQSTEIMSTSSRFNYMKATQMLPCRYITMRCMLRSICIRSFWILQ